MNVRHAIAGVFVATTAILAVLAASSYKGNLGVYLLFTLVANALLANGFRRHALFFDTFIGIFLWLGFWLKLSLRVAFLDGQFSEQIGAFNGTGPAFDRALLIASCGLFAPLLASLVRERFFTYPAEGAGCSDSGLFCFYRKHRAPILAAFLVSIVAIAASNVWLGVYQRGMVAQTVLPFGLNGLYKWLLQFGLASVSALIVRFELELARSMTLSAIVVPMVESLFSNVSLLSRGMVLNMSALFIGGWRTAEGRQVKIVKSHLFAAATLFVVCFGASVYAVNLLRAGSLSYAETSKPSSVAVTMTTPLFIDRWVGIEGVLAVSSSGMLGWDLWREAWQERFVEGKISLYDRSFIDSPYQSSKIDRSIHHFVSLPGIIAFLYYPGSFAFLFVALFVITSAAALLEIACYRFCGRNLILCALISQVVAFRFASFGYVPAQSYLLFGTLLLNCALIFAAERALLCLPGRLDKLV